MDARERLEINKYIHMYRRQQKMTSGLLVLNICICNGYPNNVKIHLTSTTRRRFDASDGSSSSINQSLASAVSTNSCSAMELFSDNVDGYHRQLVTSFWLVFPIVFFLFFLFFFSFCFCFFFVVVFFLNNAGLVRVSAILGQ